MGGICINSYQPPPHSGSYTLLRHPYHGCVSKHSLILQSSSPLYPLDSAFSQPPAVQLTEALHKNGPQRSIQDFFGDVTHEAPPITNEIWRGGLGGIGAIVSSFGTGVLVGVFLGIIVLDVLFRIFLRIIVVRVLLQGANADGYRSLDRKDKWQERRSRTIPL
jgi:hypothetical protein